MKPERKPLAAIKPIEPVDETVARILEEQQRRFDEQKLSPAERKLLAERRKREQERKRKEQAKAEARKNNRVTTELPVSLINRLKTIAESEGVSISQVITFFLFEALERFEKREFSFWSYKYKTESPRYHWNLVHPKDEERMAKIKSQENQKW